MKETSKEIDKTDNFSIWVLVIIRAFRNFAAGLVNVAFPYFVLTELRGSSLLLGSLYAAATIGTALMGLFVGISTDRSPKRTFVISLALLPISTTILVLYPNSIALVFVAAIVGGISATGSLASGGVGGYVQPVQSTIIARVTARRDRTFYYGLLSFLAGITSALGALFAGFPTIGDSLILASVAGMASAIPALFLRLPKQQVAERKANESRFHLKSGNIIGKFGITGMVNGFANGLVLPFLIPFFYYSYGTGIEEMRIFATLSGLAGSFALLLAPRLEAKLGFLKGIIFSRGSAAVLALIFPFIHLLPVSLAIYFLLPPLRVIAFPVVQTAMTDMIDKGELGKAFGINQSARLTITSPAELFAGYEFNLASYDIPFVTYALVIGANLYLYSRFFSGYAKSRIVSSTK
ncbi:MAG: MFS transporter [Nitrososphaerales archaeon]